MPERLPDIPAGSTIRQNTDGSWWFYYLPQVGPWLPMPTPQGAAPWTDGPAAHSREPASVVADASPTPADRMALAICRLIDPVTGTCATGEICRRCRQDSAAVAHEIARQFRKHYGSSVRADWLDGAGSHTPGGVQSVHP